MKTYLLSLLLAVSAVADMPSIKFGLETKETVVSTNTATKQIEGRFWTEWIVETNHVPRVAMAGFHNMTGSPFDQWTTIGNIVFSDIPVITATNYWIGQRCDKEHVDHGEHEEIRYVSSNLVSFLVWRGQTNRHYLESIPITNLVRKWKYEQQKVYTDK